MGINRDDVISAYRLFLDREPENSDVIECWISGSPSIPHLRNGFLNSDEFRKKNSLIMPSMSGFEPAIESQIDSELTPIERENLFFGVKEAWTKLGLIDPYWAVASSDEFHNIYDDSHIDKFYASGSYDLELIKKTLNRNNILLTEDSTVVEYGCGLGRVTIHLAKEFKNIVAVDIADSMLSAAKTYMLERNILNIDFRLLKSVECIESLPKCDFFFSFIVLQHSPPPIISLAIRTAIERLNPKGVALFQVPTYIPNYNFIAKKYILGEESDLFKPAHNQYELHAIRQSDLFKIIQDAGGILLEIIENTMLGLDCPGSMSNTLLVQKL
jgi:2-polyprenyl-3-methyl-5-hydroxy-6-metoxy-1,4-benzoquinol methylase